MAGHTLLFLHPAHFHAALTLRQRDSRVNDDIYIYGRDGPDLQRFLALIDAFNSRHDQPTRWQPQVYVGADPLDRLIAEKRGRAVILAGRNDCKAVPIARLHEADFAVLADKPLLLRRDELDLLRRALTNPPLLMDIMTERFDTSWEITRRLVRDAAVFGHWATGGSAPAVAIECVHQIHKAVNGRVLQRPAWFFDFRIYGNGIIDIPTHLVDIVQWLLGPAAFDYARDVVLKSARLWATPIGLSAFQRITGLAEWPKEMAPLVSGDWLPLPCNGEITYALRGVSVRLHSVWNLTQAPEEDRYHAELLGSRACIVMDHAMGRDGGRGIVVIPRAEEPGVESALRSAVERMRSAYPGIRVQARADGLAVLVPSELEQSHEELFGRVLDHFLTGLEEQAWPAEEAGNMLCKYSLLAEASALAQEVSPS